MSLTRCWVCGSPLCSACFMPRNWLSSTSRRSRSWISSYAAWASGERHWYSLSSRTAREVSCGQRVELGLGQPGVVARVGEQRASLRLERLVEQLADLLERAVEATGPARLPLALPDLAEQVVEAAAAGQAAPQQLRQRLCGCQPAEHVVADLVDRLGDVVRRRERIVAAVPLAVPGAPHLVTLLIGSRRRSGRRRSPSTAGAAGRALRGRTRDRPPRAPGSPRPRRSRAR